MDRFEHLMNLWNDGTISGKEAAELKELLQISDNRKVLVEEFLLTEGISEILNEAEAAPARKKTHGSHRHTRALRGRRSPFSSFGIWAAAAACLVIMAGAFLYNRHAEEDTLDLVRARLVDGGRGVAVKRGADVLSGESGMEILAGDSVITESVEAVLRYVNEETLISIGVQSELNLNEDTDGKLLRLEKGKAVCNAAPQPAGKTLRILSPDAETTVVGTVFTLKAAGSQTRLDVTSGKVGFKRLSDGREISVEAGFYADTAIDELGPFSLDPAVLRKEPAVLHPQPAPAAENTGPLVRYLFNEGSGSIVRDTSERGTPLDLTISDSSSVTWTDQGLTINTPVRIISSVSAAKITDACRRTGEVTIEAWLTPNQLRDITAKIGQCRIVTISSDPNTRNISFGQGELKSDPSVFAGRIRESGKGGDRNGLKALITSRITDFTHTRFHVVLSREARGRTRLWVNGEIMADRPSIGTLDTWDRDFRLALGAEVSGKTTGGRNQVLTDPQDINRAWTGTFHFIAMYDRALAGTEIKKRFTAGLKR